MRIARAHAVEALSKWVDAQARHEHATSRDIAPGDHYCHRCKRVTRWEPGTRGAQHCAECGDRFPCRERCGHLDCGAVRAVKP